MLQPCYQPPYYVYQSNHTKIISPERKLPLLHFCCFILCKIFLNIVYFRELELSDLFWCFLTRISKTAVGRLSILLLLLNQIYKQIFIIVEDPVAQVDKKLHIGLLSILIFFLMKSTVVKFFIAKESCLVWKATRGMYINLKLWTKC